MNTPQAKPSSTYQPPPDRGLEIQYMDQHLLMLNKPSGLLSVPGRGPDKQDCLISRVQQTYPEALTVHRLDMGTSGLVVLARSPEVQAAMSRLFEQRQVHKCYVALVAGLPNPDEGDIDLPLITDWPNRPRQKVDHESGKPAQTSYRVLSYDDRRDVARMQLNPLTGRSHQLRVHMAQLGHPILGDELYALPEVQGMSPRLALHAAAISFEHPMQDEPLRIQCMPDF